MSIEDNSNDRVVVVGTQFHELGRSVEMLTHYLLKGLEESRKETIWSSCRSAASIVASAILPLIIEGEINSWINEIQGKCTEIKPIVWIVIKYGFSLALFIVTYFIIYLVIDLVKKAINSNADNKVGKKGEESSYLLYGQIINLLLMGISYQENGDKQVNKKKLLYYQAINCFSEGSNLLIGNNIIESTNGIRKHNREFLDTIDGYYIYHLLRTALDSLNVIAITFENEKVKYNKDRLNRIRSVLSDKVLFLKSYIDEN